MYHILKLFHHQWTQVVTGRLTQEQPERQTRRVLYGEGRTFYAKSQVFHLYTTYTIYSVYQTMSEMFAVICIKEIETSLFNI